MDSQLVYGTILKERASAMAALEGIVPSRFNTLYVTVLNNI